MLTALSLAESRLFGRDAFAIASSASEQPNVGQNGVVFHANRTSEGGGSHKDADEIFSNPRSLAVYLSALASETALMPMQANQNERLHHRTLNTL